MKSRYFDWSDVIVGELRTMAGLGASAQQMADKAADMSGDRCTRNMVAGALSRRSIECKGKSGFNVTRKARVISAAPLEPVRRVRGRAPHGFSRPINEVLAPPLSMVAQVIPDDAKTILDLGERDCRWPFGSGPYRFCGHCKAEPTKLHRKPQYCAEHMLDAFRAAERKATPTEPSFASYQRAA